MMGSGENMSKKRILVVEDEAHLAEGLKLNLSLKGYDVKVAADGVSALQEWKEWEPDLMVLDIMLPELDGLSVLRNIRLEDERLPVLILSARGDSDDKIKGFSCGVDDYLAKPFNLEEFLLRVERLMTRGGWSQKEANLNGNDVLPAPEVYKFGHNRIYFETLTAHGPSGRINLTDQEARLLKIFIANRGKPLSRSELLETGWGYEKGTTTRTVDNFIVRFRKYFEDNPKKPLYFKSLRSVGYIFNHGTESERRD
jgi:two-component system, OmpR family, alkaline phosphatase synthesis response regulator PhoP